MTALTASRLRELLKYDSQTGDFTWRKKPNRKIVANSIAGSPNSAGYWQISIDDCDYLAHRLAWLYVTGRWPMQQIDHINGDRLDNRLSNLREADSAQNNSNRGIQKNNRSGFKGVSFHKGAQKWTAEIKRYGKKRYLGLYKTAAEAAEAYAIAANEMHGEFARVN